MVVGEKLGVVGVQKVNEDGIVFRDRFGVGGDVEAIGDLYRAANGRPGLVDFEARRDGSALGGFVSAARDHEQAGEAECQDRRADDLESRLLCFHVLTSLLVYVRSRIRSRFRRYLHKQTQKYVTACRFRQCLLRATGRGRSFS